MSHIYGIISYIPEAQEFTLDRIRNHRKQLEWLQTFITEQDIIWRVENCWTTAADYLLLQEIPGLPIKSYTIDKPQYPGANRNVLLDILYQSNADWLVCMDDDRALYDYYDGIKFFTQELDSDYGLSLAKKGVLIKALSPVSQPFKKDCGTWPYRQKSWYMERMTPSGFLQVCCIPNLIKYGYKPVYFNSDTACQLNDAPEDLQFELDWLGDKHGIALNKNLIMKEFGGDVKSTLYPTKEYREQVHKSHRMWVEEYLRQKFPRNPKLWKKSNLNRLYNSYKQEFFPRSVPWRNEWEV